MEQEDEKKLTRGQRHYLKHREECLARSKAYSKRRPEVCRAISRRCYRKKCEAKWALMEEQRKLQNNEE